MAKIPYTKLKLVPPIRVNKVNIGGADIEVKTYLPMKDKVKLVQDIVNQSLSEKNYTNPLAFEIYSVIEIILAYTNISITASQREDIYKVYDNFISIWDTIEEAVGASELFQITEAAREILHSIEDYDHSAQGIIDNLAAKTDALNLEIQKLQKNIQNPENLTLIKDILTKLG